MLDIYVNACFNLYSSSRDPLFSPLQVKNQKHDEITNMHLFLNLAWPQTITKGLILYYSVAKKPNIEYYKCGILTNDENTMC
jgi:hypothetical protein